MKRTPLTRKAPIAAAGSWLRRTPIAAVSVKRARLGPERARVVAALRIAQSGICVRCGQSGLVLHGHEREGMAHGASYVRPDVALCDPCNGAIEDEPRVSAWDGWKISGKWPRDPGLQPWEARAVDGRIVTFASVAEGWSRSGFGAAS